MTDKQNHSQGQSGKLKPTGRREPKRLTSKTAGVRKEKDMNSVSEYEIETFLKMILEIIKGCKDLQEAQDKIKALLER